jgi:hypothetical protein
VGLSRTSCASTTRATEVSFRSNDSTDEIYEAINVDNNEDQLQATIERLRNDCSMANMYAMEAKEKVQILRKKITEAEADLRSDSRSKSDFWEVRKGETS